MNYFKSQSQMLFFTHHQFCSPQKSIQRNLLLPQQQQSKFLSCCCLSSLLSKDKINPSKNQNTTTLDEATKSSIIVEKATDKTVQRVQGELSWMSAGMLYIAIQASIRLDHVFDSKSDKKALFAQEWTLVGILFIVVLIISVIPELFENPHFFANKLLLTIPQMKAASGDEYHLKMERKKLEKAKLIKHKQLHALRAMHRHSKSYHELRNTKKLLLKPRNTSRVYPAQKVVSVWENRSMTVEDVKVTAKVQKKKKKKKQEKTEMKDNVDQIEMQKEDEKKGEGDEDSDLFELEINVLRKNVIKLFVETLANVVAISLKDANKLTFVTLAENINEKAMAYWTFAFFESSFLAWISIRLGLTLSNLEMQTYNQLIDTNGNVIIINNNNNNSKEEKYPKKIRKLIIDYAVKRRFIKMLIFLLGLVMAWAWKDALKASIFIFFSPLAKYSAILMEFLYAIIVTLIVSFLNTILSRYYFLYPRDNDYYNLSLKLETKQREMVGKVFYKNIQKIVGLVWYDALWHLILIICNRSSSDENKMDIVLSWFFVLFILLMTNIFEFYWQRIWLLLSLENNGIINSIFDAYKLIFDPKYITQTNVEKIIKHAHSSAIMDVSDIDQHCHDFGAMHTTISKMEKEKKQENKGKKEKKKKDKQNDELKQNGSGSESETKEKNNELEARLTAVILNKAKEKEKNNDILVNTVNTTLEHNNDKQTEQLMIQKLQEIRINKQINSDEHATFNIGGVRAGIGVSANSESNIDVNKEEKQFRLSFWRHYWFHIIELIIYSFGIAGGYCISFALALSLSYFYNGFYNAQTQNMYDVSLWSIWIAWLILFSVALLIMFLCSQKVMKFQKKRKDLVKNVLKSSKIIQQLI